MTARLLTALPVYNEVRHVRDVLQEVQRYCADVLVVDDGSTDGTSELLDQLAAESGIQVVHHARNQGYGAAIQTAFQVAVEQQYAVLVTIDCDGQHQPSLIPQLAAAIHMEDENQPTVSPPWDLVSGSRYLEIFDESSVPPVERRQINVEITRQLNECFDLKLTDAFCGFKAYRVASLRGLEITEFGYAMPLQLWVQAVSLGMKIREFPVPLIYLDEARSFGGSLDDSQRRMAYYQEVLRREMDAQEVPCGADRDSNAS